MSQAKTKEPTLRYQIDMKSQFSRWGNAYKDGLSDNMQILVNVVEEALNSGVFYKNDLFYFIDSRLGGFLTDEQKSYRIDSVEHGYWGLEISYARSYIEKVTRNDIKNKAFLDAKKIPLRTEYKNISLFITGKRYNFTSLILSALIEDQQRLEFVTKRRGVKGTATLRISAYVFFKAIKESAIAPAPSAIAQETQQLLFLDTHS